MNKYTLVGLSITGGVLSGLAWMGWCTGLVLLFSFVPFLIIENHLYSNKKRYTSNACFILLLPGFVLFSIIVLGWMRVASITGAVCVIMGLAFLMSFTLWLAHLVRLRAGLTTGIIAFITFWLGFEYITLNVNIISPWLNLGNGLSKDVMFIQWYEITGTGGGTLWILISNLLLAVIIIRSAGNKRNVKYLIMTWLIIITVPILFSFYMYHNLKPVSGTQEEVVIIQPNIDPYTEKFTKPFKDQLNMVINMADTTVSQKTVWVLTPETTVDDPVDLNGIEKDKYITIIKEFTSRYPNASVVSGLVSYREYPPTEEAPTKSARKKEETGIYFDHFNSAFRIDTGQTVEVYHKSKLVPGVEMQFSTGPTRFISTILPFLGGNKMGIWDPGYQGLLCPPYNKNQGGACDLL